MKDYDYWTQAWPKIVFSTFANGGRMFEVMGMKDEQGIWHYKRGAELTIDEALLNAKPELRKMTMALFENKREAVSDGRKKRARRADTAGAVSVPPAVEAGG